MNIQRISAVLLVASFAIIVISFLVGVPGFYQTQDIAERVRLVEEYRTRWNITIAINMALSLLPAIGLVLFGVHHWRSNGTLLAVLGASVYALGAISYVIHEYVRYTDLVGHFEGKYLDYHGIGNWFVLAGLFVVGVSSLQVGLPTWLAYLTLGLSIVLAVILLIAPGFFFAIPFFAIALLLIFGIVHLRG
jgi:hypothetical protein